MKLSAQVRNRLKLQNSVFVALFLVLCAILAFLSYKYSYTADWSSSKHHSLSESSVKLLQTLKSNITLTVFISGDNPKKRVFSEMLERYKRASTAVTVKFIDPAIEPDVARSNNVSADGEMLVTYQGNTEHIKKYSEQQIMNSLYRLARPDNRWVLFVDGHGERKPDGIANHDLGTWGKQLVNKGLKVRTLNLVENPIIPQSTAVLVIASPQIDYLPGELHSIQQYLDQGGNLIWFTEPSSTAHLSTLAEYLGIRAVNGTVIDPNTQKLLNGGDPSMAIVPRYTAHDITGEFNAVTLYPKAAGFKITDPGQWKHVNILQTLPSAWIETGDLQGQVSLNPGVDIPGPVTLGIAITRTKPISTEASSQSQNETTFQRIAVIGDGDFLSNRFIANGGNMELGFKLINWLSQDDQFIKIPVDSSADISITLTRTEQIVIAFGFLITIPLLLGGSGFFIWMRRRNR